VFDESVEVVTFAVSLSAALSLISRVRLVIAVILYLQRLCVHYAVADSTEKLHPGIFTELPSMA